MNKKRTTKTRSTILLIVSVVSFVFVALANENEDTRKLTNKKEKNQVSTATTAQKKSKDWKKVADNEANSQINTRRGKLAMDLVQQRLDRIMEAQKKLIEDKKAKEKEAATRLRKQQSRKNEKEKQNKAAEKAKKEKAEKERIAKEKAEKKAAAVAKKKEKKKNVNRKKKQPRKRRKCNVSPPSARK